MSWDLVRRHSSVDLADKTLTVWERPCRYATRFTCLSITGYRIWSLVYHYHHNYDNLIIQITLIDTRNYPETIYFSIKMTVHLCCFHFLRQNKKGGFHLHLLGTLLLYTGMTTLVHSIFWYPTQLFIFIIFHNLFKIYYGLFKKVNK